MRRRWAPGWGGQGKEECWLVIAAEPGARLAIGFREPVDAATMRAAALDGSIEDLLEWHDVAPGDFFYIPANTVHAIGAGISLVEVSRTATSLTGCTITAARANCIWMRAWQSPMGGHMPPGWRRTVPVGGAVTLVDGPLFRLDRLDGPPDPATAARYAGALLVIPLDCTPTIAGEPVTAGSCGLAHALANVSFPESGLCLIAQPV